MRFPRSPHQVSDPRLRLRYLSASVLALALFAGLASPANATIDNTATATGTAPDASTVSDPSNPVAVPVAPADPQLVVTKTFVSLTNVIDSAVVAVDDTITYSVEIANTGTITMYDVAPSETVNGAGITFNGIPGTGSFAAMPAGVTLAPGASNIFTLTYTLSNDDAYRAAAPTGINLVDNEASATGLIGSPFPTGTAIMGADVTNDNDLSNIPETPRIVVAKSHVFNPGGNGPDADVGDVIEYTYTVSNTGNTMLTAVSVTDDHEIGAAIIIPGIDVTANTSNETHVGPLDNSSDTTANDGTWDNLAPGKQVTFAYHHTVTQAEFNNQ